MTTTAKLADGTVLNFPDGTPQEVIQGVVKKHLGGQAAAPTLMDDIKRQAGLTGRALLEGASTPVEIVGNAANGVANLGISGINALAGTDIPKFQTYGQYRDSALEKGGFPKPEGAGEKIVNETAKMMTGAAAMGGVARAGEMAGTRLLAPLGENMGQQVAGGAGGGAALGVAKEKTDNPWLQFGASVAGALAGGSAAPIAERVANAVRPAPAPPSTEAIGNAGRAAYQQAEAAGAILRPQAMQNLQQQIQTDLANFGYHPQLQPRVAVVLDELNRVGQQNITANGVDTVRRIALQLTRSNDASERTLGGMVVGHIDDMMDNLTPADVVQGNAPQAAAAFTRARELWRTYRKSELLDNLLVKGEDQAMSTNSGGNVQNAIRQKLRSILDNPKTNRLFTQDERDALRQVVRGSATQNTLRTIGRLAPSSNSWLPILLGGGPGGYAAGGVPGAAAALAVPTIGSAAKAAATALTRRAVGQVSDQVRGAAFPPPAPPQAAPVNVQQLMVQGLLRGGTALQENPYAQILMQSGPRAAAADDRRNRGPR